MSPKPVTIYDIAAKADVSIATVSRAINDSERISAKTRSRILDIAHELGYQPHASARSLAKRQSNLVSAVIPMMTSYFYLEVLQGIQDLISRSSFDLLVFSAPSLEEVDAVLDHALTKGLSAGVLLFSSPLNEKRLARMRKNSPPLVLVDQYHDGFDSVSIDNELGGYMAVRYLLDCGYRRIGIITAHADSVPSIKRMQGYQKASAAHGLTVDPGLVVSIEDPQFHGYTEEAGYEAMVQLLALENRPDAVFAVSDIQAIGALRAIADRGLKVPDDIVVIGFDDIVISRHIGLTTLRQPMYDMGKRAIEILLQRIESPKMPVNQTVFEPELIERTSSRSSKDGKTHNMVSFKR